MKCSKCLFSKKVNETTIECCNIRSDEYGYKQFVKWDGCNDGKSTKAEMDKQELIILKMVKAGE